MKFSKFIAKKLQLPKVYFEAAETAFGGEYNEVSMTLRHVNTTIVKPGDIIVLNYPGDPKIRKFFITATDRGPRGRFKSEKGNLLLCGYDLSEKETLTGLITIFSFFYKQRDSKYNSAKRIMNSILGEDRFKTFMISKISDSFSLEVTSGKA